MAHILHDLVDTYFVGDATESHARFNIWIDSLCKGGLAPVWDKGFDERRWQQYENDTAQEILDAVLVFAVEKPMYYREKKLSALLSGIDSSIRSVQKERLEELPEEFQTSIPILALRDFALEYIRDSLEMLWANLINNDNKQLVQLEGNQVFVLCSIISQLIELKMDIPLDRQVLSNIMLEKLKMDS